jgi:hypothetical protein
MLLSEINTCRTFNHGVLGSIPSALTERNQALRPNSKNEAEALCLQCVCQTVAAEGKRGIEAPRPFAEFMRPMVSPRFARCIYPRHGTSFVALASGYC